MGIRLIYLPPYTPAPALIDILMVACMMRVVPAKNCSSVEELLIVLQDALSHVCKVRLRQYLVNHLVREERATVCHGTTLHDGEDRTHNLAAHLLASGNN